MQCTLNIGLDVVCNSISYKYVVHSPNRNNLHPYEVLQDTSSKLINRSLMVPKAKCVEKGIGSVAQNNYYTIGTCGKSIAGPWH